MIKLDAFVQAIQGAILGANQALMKQNERLLENYFDLGGANSLDEAIENNEEIHPKSIKVDYPIENNDGTSGFAKIDVPLITLVPLSMSQIDKAILTNHFKMMTSAIGDELELEFVGSQDESTGTIEVTLCPHEIAQGMRLVVEGYDAILKRQIPH